MCDPNKAFRLLLHTETSDGSVIPVWEDVQPQNVEVLREVMEKKESIGKDIALSYRRIPITAERPPDFSDLSDLMDVVIRNYSSNTPMIFNCQLGRGRSTLTSVSEGVLFSETTNLIQCRSLCSWSSSGYNLGREEDLKDLLPLEQVILRSLRGPVKWREGPCTIHTRLSTVCRPYFGGYFCFA